MLTNFCVSGGRFEENFCCTSCRPLKEDTCLHLKNFSIPNISWDIVSFCPAGPVDAPVEPGDICWYHASLLKITTLVANWGAELCLTSVLNSALRAGIVQPGYIELWCWKVSRQWGVELLKGLSAMRSRTFAAVFDWRREFAGLLSLSDFEYGHLLSLLVTLRLVYLPAHILCWQVGEDSDYYVS